MHTLLSNLPADFSAPILVVQHISHGFVRGLADWLNKEGRLHVKLAEEGETIKKRNVYLAPDDRHLAVTLHGQIALSADPAVGGFDPPPRRCSNPSPMPSAPRPWRSS